MKKIYAIVIFFVLVISSYSQIILNSNLGSVPNPCGQLLYDSGGPGGSYTNNQNFTATFCAPAGQFITINFTAFNTEAGFDFLSIYNGNSTAAPLLGTFSGAALPGSFTSTQGGCITIRFTSDGSVVSSGWTASLSCSNVGPPAPPPQIILNGNLGTNSNACGNLFYDSGGPNGNYTNNQNFIATFCAPAGQVLSINFTAFNLESNFDFLSIYNGNSTASPLVGQYTGSTLPPSFSTPVGGCVTIRFTSDGSVVFSGWTASITCVTPGPPPPGVTFNFTGAIQTWTVPPCVNMVTVTARGAKGGGVNGGLGASITGTLAVTPGQVLQVNVGGMGNQGGASGGFNGGGNGQASSGSAIYSSWGGGGASDVRIAPFALPNRVIVAGGGGGRSGGSTQVGGGNANCNNGVNGANSFGTGGGGGTQFAGGNGGAGWAGTPTGGFAGTIGQGGAGGIWQTAPGGGGGGGYYGGGGGGNDGCCTGGNGGGGGGGGSSLVPPGGTCLPANNALNGLVIISFSASASGTISAVANPTSVCSGNTSTISLSGGLTYTTNPGNIVGSSFTVSPFVTTTYSVTASLLGGCNTATANVTVAVNPLPVVLPSSNSPVCPGSNLNLTSQAATSYTWTGPNGFISNLQNPTISNVSNSMGGVYTLSVTNASGCVNSATTNVTVNPPPTITINTPTNAICNGNTNNLFANGAVNYTWNPGSLIGSAVTISPSVTTIYTVTGANVAGCSNTNTVLITVNPLPTLTAIVSPTAICFGNNASVLYSGAFTYTTNTGNLVGSALSLSPGSNTTYTVSGASALGCLNTNTFDIVVNPLPLITVNNPTTCLNSTFTLSASGGTAYAWSGPNGYTSNQQNPVITNASLNMTGNYTVLVTNVFGCTNTAVSSLSVVSLPPVSIAGTSTLCSNNYNGSPALANLTASGATSYTWTLPFGYFGNPNLNSSNISVVPLNTSVQSVETVTLTGELGTCTNSAVFTLTVVPNPTISVTSGSMCAGTSVVLNANGATTYTWSPSLGLNTTNGSQVIASPNNTTIYNVIGSTAGCNSQTELGTATVVPNPTVVISPPQPFICFGDNITLTANGATDYTWTPSTALSSINTSVTIANPIVTTTYSVLGSQATCTNLASITVTVLALPVLTVTPSSPTLCMNNYNGSPNSVTITANGANTYSWGPINGLIPNTLNGSTIIGVSDGSSIGTGTVIGTVGTCSNISTFTVNAVTNPTISVTSGSMCAGTSVVLNANGATTYTWSPSLGLNTTSGPQVTASPNNTTIYNVIGSTAGCNSQTELGTATVVPNPTVVISPPQPFICFGENITLTANGATDYTWTPSTALSSINTSVTIANPTITTTYNILGSQATCTNLASVTVTILALPVLTVTPSSPTLCMNNYNGSPNSVTITANGANTYSWGPINGLIPNTLNGSTIIGVSDGSSIGTGTVIGTVGTCSNISTFTVNAVTNPTISVTSGSMCAGTSVVLNANGATTYTWSPSLGLNTTSGPQVIASPNNTTIYNVIGSTAGCNSQTELGTATVVPNPTVVITPANPVICFGETISLTANGATDYTWTPSTALSSINTSVTIANPTLTTTYNILGSQATCTNLASVTVTVLPLPVVTIVSSSPTLCMNNYNGSPNTVSFTASGAVSYTWGPINGLTANTLNGSTIIGTSSNGALNGIVTVVGSVGNCTNIATFTVNAVPNPTISVTSGSMCAGTSLVLNANGATTYTWSPSLGLNTTSGPQVVANPNNTTIYNVIGSTAGCNSQTETGTATVVPNPTVVITPANPIICFGKNISLTASGATDYTWTPTVGLSSPNSANTIANPTITTTYNILGSQATCTNLASVTVTVINLPVVNITSSSPTLCMNNYNGSPNTVSFTASGANTYTWGPINGLIPNTLNGSTIIGTSSNGSALGTVTVTGTVGTCSNTATFTVNAVVNPTISVTSGSMCAGTSVVLNASGASTYTWSPSNALNVINGPQVIANPLGTSIYNVIGSTAGCNSQTQSGTATVVPNPTVVITPANPFICFGKNISLTAIGATDYTWTPTIGLSSPNSANTIANPTITTTYNILGSQATCTNLASVTVTVINLPVVNITSSSPTLCMNNFNGSPNSVVLTASGANTYTWGPISGLMPNTLNGSTIIGTSSNGAAVGTVTVTGTVGTCSNTATFTVNAVVNPTISVTSGSMCAGTSVVLNASGANTYTWSPSIGLNTISGPQVTANPTVTTVYNVIGTTAGCNSQTQIGLANVVPNPTITISPVNPYICFGNSVSLSASGATTYTWLPNTALSNTSAINVIANPTVTTTYTIIGSQATCTNTAVNTVTVLPLPVPTITSSAQACIYTPVNLQTSPGYSLYQWTGPIGYSSNVSNATFTANTIAQTGTYNLNVTDAFGCIGTASTSIIINPLPSGILSRDDKNNCVPFCAVFKVNTTGSPIVNTVWQVNYQTVFTPTLSYCLNKAGSYTVGALFSDANGCSNTATFTIKAYESPVANFAYSPINPTEGLETVTFTNTSTGSANSGWNWYFINNNGYLSNQPNTSYLFEQAGNYPVALVVKNKFGCSDTIIQVINVAEDHSLYVPNAFTPNYDGRNDVFLPKGRGISKYNLMVFDRWGQKLFESNDFTEGWDGTFGGVLCKNDVYIWKIIASFSNAKPKEYTGQIMLIK